MSFLLNNNQLPERHHDLKAIAAFRQKAGRLLNSFTVNPILRYFDIARPEDIANVPLFLVVRQGNWAKITTGLNLTNTQITFVDGFTNPVVPSAPYHYVTNSATITILFVENSITITWQATIMSFLLHPQLDRIAINDRLPIDAVPIEAIAGGITFAGDTTFAPNKFSINANGEGVIGINSLTFGTPVDVIIEQSAIAERQGEFIAFKVQPFAIIYYVEFRGEIYLPVADRNNPQEYEFYHDTNSDIVIIFTKRGASVGLLYIRDDNLANRVIGVIEYDRPTTIIN